MEWPSKSLDHILQLVEELRAGEETAATTAVEEAGRAEGLAVLLAVMDGLLEQARPLLAAPRGASAMSMLTAGVCNAFL